MILRGIAISKEWKAMGKPVSECEICKEGLVGDIHYGSRKSPVTILPYERVQDYFADQDEELWCGRFGENLLVEGLDWDSLEIGTRLTFGDVILEIERISAGGPKSEAYKGFKVCSPMEPWFLFCRVVQGGWIRM